MKKWIVLRLRQFLISISLSFALLSLANMQTIWYQYKHQHDDPRGFVMNTVAPHGARADQVVKLDPTPKSAYKPLQSQFSQSLEQDELKDGNPFVTLETLDPIREIMKFGVSQFQRDTYRSPDYQDESGYDMLHYQVVHPDGRRSEILAYLENSSLTEPHDVGAPDLRVPVIVFLIPDVNQNVHYLEFRGGHLQLDTKFPQAKAQELVSDRLNQAVPFLSVAR